jgi:hypothetical protein
VDECKPLPVGVNMGSPPSAPPPPLAVGGAGDYRQVGPDRYCLPRYPPHSEPSFPELNGF